MRKLGFTFIELLLAVGLFSLAIPMVVTIFVSASRVQRETTALLMANSSVGFALEQMAREMRTGKNFTCTVCGQDVSFTNAKGESVTYSLLPAETSPSLPRRIGRGTGAVEAITSPSVNIKALQIFLRGNPPYTTGNTYPTLITISIRANPRIKNANLTTELDFQTSVSARFDY
jgi:type II secretory pathway pseudopilin PulG